MPIDGLDQRDKARSRKIDEAYAIAPLMKDRAEDEVHFGARREETSAFPRGQCREQLVGGRDTPG